MSVQNFLKRFHDFTDQYANQDPTTEVALGAFGELKGCAFWETAELEDYFDDYNIKLARNHDDGRGAGLLYTSGGEVSGKVKITGTLENEAQIKITDGGVTRETKGYRSYSGVLTASFSRRHSYLFSCSNYVHEKLVNLDDLQRDLIRIFKEPGREWRRDTVVVTGRTFATRSSLIVANAATNAVRLNVTVTAEDSARLDIGKELSLEALQKMGLTVDANYASSSNQLFILTDSDGEGVPILKFHKLKGYGDNVRLEPVR